MAQVCKACELGSNTVQKLEKDYVDGMSVSSISRKYKVAYFSIRYHIENHLPDKLVKGADKKFAANGFDLMERVDKLLGRVEKIFRRNYRKGKDMVALKALSEERNTIELLAKVSFALHQNQLAEVEQENRKLMDVNIPLERLTKQEQYLYFQINQKLLGEKVTDKRHSNK